MLKSNYKKRQEIRRGLIRRRRLRHESKLRKKTLLLRRLKRTRKHR